MMKRLAAAMMIGALVAVPAMAQTADEVVGRIETAFGYSEPVVLAFDTVQAAVGQDDMETVAAMVAYPITVVMDGEGVTIENPDDFVAFYDRIVTPEIRQAVVEQAFEDLFVNSEGVMFGNGQMWLGGVCRDDACAESDVRIIAIQSTLD